MTLPVIYWSLSKLTSLLNKYDTLNQIISENKPYNLCLCTFTLHKFQEKNLNLNRDSNSDLQIFSLALCHWAILVLIPVHLQTEYFEMLKFFLFFPDHLSREENWKDKWSEAADMRLFTYVKNSLDITSTFIQIVYLYTLLYYIVMI